MERRSQLQRRTPLQGGGRLPQMSAKRRAELAERGNSNPFTTLTNTSTSAGGGVPRMAAPAPKRRPKPAVPAAVRAALIERSGGRCEIGFPCCTGAATDPAHRIKQGMGGRRGDAVSENNSLSNVMYACRACHDRSHMEPEEAYGLGVRLREGFDPRTEPALYRGRRVHLDDLGAVTAAPATPNQEQHQTEGALS